MNWIALRTKILDLQITGTYTLPNGDTLPAISIDTKQFPPAGATVEGLEVVIIPATKIERTQYLGRGILNYEGECLIRQFNPVNDTLEAIKKLSPLFNRIRVSPRVFPSTGFAEIETVTITFEYFDGDD